MVSIAKFMEEDHDRLDEHFESYLNMKDEDVMEAKHKHFKPFFKGLKRHIVWEEKFLFPAFEEKTGMTGMGPTEVMRQEHVQIKDVIEKIHEHVRNADPDIGDLPDQLRAVLGPHNDKEESILYPAIDEHLSDEEKEGLMKKMKDLPQSEYYNCCGSH